MIRCIRLTKAIEVIDHWFAFREGFLTLAGKHQDKVDLEQMLKVCCQLAVDSRHGFVALVLKDDVFEGFGVVEDVSPIFSTERTFLCRAFWHKTGNSIATNQLMNFFEEWARDNGVRRYSVMTKRNSGAATRCFQSAKYGFHVSQLMFSKELQ